MIFWCETCYSWATVNWWWTQVCPHCGADGLRGPAGFANSSEGAP